MIDKVEWETLIVPRINRNGLSSWFIDIVDHTNVYAYSKDFRALMVFDEMDILKDLDLYARETHNSEIAKNYPYEVGMSSNAMSVVDEIETIFSWGRPYFSIDYLVKKAVYCGEHCSKSLSSKYSVDIKDVQIHVIYDENYKV